LADDEDDESLPIPSSASEPVKQHGDFESATGNAKGKLSVATHAASSSPYPSPFILNGRSPTRPSPLSCRKAPHPITAHTSFSSLQNRRHLHLRAPQRPASAPNFAGPSDAAAAAMRFDGLVVVSDPYLQRHFTQQDLRALQVQVPPPAPRFLDAASWIE
jgi:hypothetical protein